MQKREPSQRDRTIFKARQSGVSPKDLGRQYHITQERIRQICMATGMFLMKEDFASMAAQGKTDDEALAHYKANYSLLNYTQQSILYIWEDISKNYYTPPVTQKGDIPMDFITQELHRLTGLNQDCYMIGRSLYVQLREPILARIDLLPMPDKNKRYNGLMIKIIHKLYGETDSVAIRFADAMGKTKPVNPLAADNKREPAIQENQSELNQFEWVNVILTDQHYKSVQRMVQNYLQLF